MKNTKKITGHTLPPLSGNAPKALLVLLHGYGGNGHYLFQALSSLRDQFPDVAIAIPDGPVQLEKDVYAWIKLSFPIQGEQLWKGAEGARPDLINYITAELDILGLKENQLILLGFSQGAIMALHTGLRLKTDPLGIIALSGFLAGEDNIGSIRSRPPVYLINGDMDTIVLPGKVDTTELALSKAGIEVHHTLIKGTGH